MVVKSNRVTVSVKEKEEVPSKIPVSWLGIDVNPTTITVGESVTVKAFAVLADTVKSGYKAYVDIYLKCRDPDGIEKELGVKTDTVRGGANMGDGVEWTVTLNKVGTWTFWVESDDYATVAPAGLRSLSSKATIRW